MTTEFIKAQTSDGQGFVFKDQGAGPTVVLFHGFPDTPHGWSTIADRLVAAGYRVVVPWLRGYHPDTIVAGRGYGAVAIAEDAIRLLDALGEESAVLVGHDWGASIVYGAASLRPERVRAIVPIDIPHSSLIRPSPSAAWGFRHFAALKMPWAERSTARDDFAYIDTLYARWAPTWTGPERDECVRRAKAAFADPRCLTGAIAYYRALSPKAPKGIAAIPSTRGLIVGGSSLIPLELYAATAAAMGPGSTSVLLESGHWPHREHEVGFLDALLPFLAGLD